jgi:hypothetical protein
MSLIKKTKTTSKPNPHKKWLTSLHHQFRFPGLLPGKYYIYIYIYKIKSDPAQWIEFWGKFAIPKSSSTRRLQLSYFGNDILSETGRIDASTRIYVTFWRVHHSHNYWLLKKRIYFWFYSAVCWNSSIRVWIVKDISYFVWKQIKLLIYIQKI